MIRVYFRASRNSIKSKLYEKGMSVSIVDGALYVHNSPANSAHALEHSQATYANGEWMRAEAEEPEKKEKQNEGRHVGSTGISLPATPELPIEG